MSDNHEFIKMAWYGYNFTTAIKVIKYVKGSNILFVAWVGKCYTDSNTI